LLGTLELAAQSVIFQIYLILYAVGFSIFQPNVYFSYQSKTTCD
jgi:hypothetical protein